MYHSAFCLTVFGAHLIILFIIEVKILALMKWSCQSPNYVDYQIYHS